MTQKKEEILDDTGTTLQHGSLTIQFAGLKHDEQVAAPGLRIGWCHVCGSWGRIVERFPRRGYGKRKNREVRGVCKR